MGKYYDEPSFNEAYSIIQTEGDGYSMRHGNLLTYFGHSMTPKNIKYW